MQLVGKSDLSTGNFSFASYVLKSYDLVRLSTLYCTPPARCGASGAPAAHAELSPCACLSQVFAFTAPYPQLAEQPKESKAPLSWYSRPAALKFLEDHGLGVRAVGERHPSTFISNNSLHQRPPSVLPLPLLRWYPPPAAVCCTRDADGLGRTWGVAAHI